MGNSALCEQQRNQQSKTLGSGYKPEPVRDYTMTKDEIIQHWVDSSEVDFKAMESLFANGHYVWSLFTGHLVLEKLLKACYVKSIDIRIPQIHDLLKIAGMAKLELSHEQKVFLDEVTTFNVKARYPDYKMDLYKRATQAFTERYIKDIKEFRTWVLKKIKN